MRKSHLPEGWCISRISDISMKGEQRKPSDEETFIYVDIGSINRDLKCIESPLHLIGKDCSGQVKLATVLESFQYKRSDSFGVNPPLY